MVKLGYTIAGNSWYKEIGSYKITVYPSQSGEVIRRVMLNNNVIDIRKMSTNEIEDDDLFKQILVQSIKVHKVVEIPKEVEVVAKKTYDEQITKLPDLLNKSQMVLGKEVRFTVGTPISQSGDIDLFKGVTLNDKGE